MKVKGSAVSSIPAFIKHKFGEPKYREWLAAVDPEAKEVFSASILAGAWYPLDTHFVKPMRKVCEMFYGGDQRGAWDIGRFSADEGLKGIYKVFIKFGSPEFIIKRASTILPTFYDAAEMTVASSDKNFCDVQITKFEGLDAMVEQRVGGWMERALEVMGCKTPSIKIAKSKVKGDMVTEYHCTWN